MRRLCGFKIGILVLMVTCICDAFHLQGQPSIRRAVCRTAPQCCPGHVCRAYQRFDASRPVAACAISIQSRPLYAPGSPVQRRICGSSSRDMLSQQRQRSRDQGFGRQFIGQRSFPGMSRQTRFPSPVRDLQQLARTNARQSFTGRSFPFPEGRDQISPFTDRSRFDPRSFASRSISSRFPDGTSRTFRSQMTTPDERPQFGFERSQFPETRRSFSPGRTPFSRGQDQLIGRSQSLGRTGFGQSSESRSMSTGQGLTEGQAIISQLSRFPTEHLTQGSSLLDQSFGFQDSLPADRPSLTSSGQSLSPSRDAAFTSRSRTVDGAVGFQDLLPQADTSRTFLSQGELPQTSLQSGASEPLIPPNGASQPLTPSDGSSQSLFPTGGAPQTFLPPEFASVSFLPSGGASQQFSPPGGASHSFLPTDGVPQALLVETPAVSKTPIKVSASGSSKNMHVEISNAKPVIADISFNNEHSVQNTEHSVQSNNVQPAVIAGDTIVKSNPQVIETQSTNLLKKA